ncbi:2-dehydropantoate 2-reductase [Marinobacter sp. M216]|uniref:2-dehydropantoate 2-reductase n=1 Tax=Marinobacter albus TaxID=3030833 RepID=A0ABT7HBT3_9GAMM|nr:MULTISPECIES: 2-dehydropantoate 2-reductase [unclassified Marinobacter]MBW7470248.1 2-dehydropantoate 2-reductase [Marinobacter sp. F4218]MDK9557487.1 2-dehydropantoate 2-reductase [Marinobacter sp. M216]
MVQATSSRSSSPRIVVFGAGSVGCYVGGRLISGGANVVMIGRARIGQTLKKHPLVVTDYQSFEFQTQLTPEQFTEDPAQVAEADLVLVTVKSAATTEAALTLARHLKPGTPVISLQNGISNAEELRQHLPNARVCAGMIPFNVVQKSPGHFHHGTEGHLMAERDDSLDAFLPLFELCGLPLELRDDMKSVMWSKLLLNLNNPINALSNVPLLEELSDRSYRRCLAAAQRETLSLMGHAGIDTIKLTAIPMRLVPVVMSLPDWLFKRLASRMLAIDPIARSSMWEDLEAGRPTEVDWINGEVVRLAETLNKSAPVNRRLTELVHECEKTRRRWPGDELLAELRAALRKANS